jgi:PIN domain nuclease of toxin-antitoxin system
MGYSQVILLDTHVLLWLVLEPHRISKNAASAIRAKHNEGGLAISAITLYEIAGLAAKSRIDLRASTELFLREVEIRFVVRPISGGLCAVAAALSNAYPRDPMDRMIGATAIVEGLTLITADESIRKSKMVSTIW